MFTPAVSVARSPSRGKIRSWWKNNPDLHYPITAYSSILLTGALIWGFLFIILGGTTDPETSSLVPFSWACLIIGGLGCFFLLPDFFVYVSLRSSFEEICSLESRTEVIRRSKEVEDAAEALGSGYRSRLLAFYREMEIKPSRRWRESPNTTHKRVTWWSGGNSKLANLLPGLASLKNAKTNKTIITMSAVALTLIIIECITGGANGSSFSVNDALLGKEPSSHPPPHFDPFSSVLILALSILLWLTTPSGRNPEDGG